MLMLCPEQLSEQLSEAVTIFSFVFFTFCIRKKSLTWGTKICDKKLNFKKIQEKSATLCLKQVNWLAEIKSACFSANSVRFTILYNELD